MATSVRTAFRNQVLPLTVTSLLGSRILNGRERHHQKYKQIAASIRTLGVIEPLVVFPLEHGKFRVLDGHKRLDILVAVGAETVECLIATHDEAYTYNKRVNYISTVSEHLMILRALEHNDEATVADALDVKIDTIRKKRDLLAGICKEAVEILKDRRVSPKAFVVLRKMKPVRQAEVAQLMRSSNLYSERFALAMLAGTRDELLTKSERGQDEGVSAEQKRRMESETDSVLRNMHAVETTYGIDLLSLTISCRYVRALIENPALKRYLLAQHSPILRELKTVIVDSARDANQAQA